MGGSPAAAFVPPSTDIEKFRLIVTGHDDEGQSVFLTDQIAPHVMTVLQTPYGQKIGIHEYVVSATVKDPVWSRN
jgi:hypothetical protein